MALHYWVYALWGKKPELVRICTYCLATWILIASLETGRAMCLMESESSLALSPTYKVVCDYMWNGRLD